MAVYYFETEKHNERNFPSNKKYVCIVQPVKPTPENGKKRISAEQRKKYESDMEKYNKCIALLESGHVDIYNNYLETEDSDNFAVRMLYDGIPERERVFIIGVKKDFGEFIIPNKIKNNQTFENVIQAVKNNNYGFPNHSDGLIEKIKYIPQGGNVMDIPEEIRPKSFKNSYSRLIADKIPPTITRNYNCPSSANCIHPYENRGLSDAEALFIQGFPNWWEVKGKTKNLQIGNSVPPKMIEWIMSGIKVY